MCSIGKFESHSYSSIPWAVESLQGVTEQVKEIASIEATAIDVVESDQDIWIAEM